MTTREKAPVGAPCWADLWTSDVEGSRRFYRELFGWESGDPDPAFGGYFMFTRHDVPVAGAMGDMGDMKADNTWKPYLATDDMTRTVSDAGENGAQVVVPAMPVADLGIQSVLVDPTGAAIGAWQPGTFPGFTVIGEPGAPSWFELHTRDFAAATAFYGSVFGWELELIGDSDEFRYAAARVPGSDDEVAGIMDASGFLPDGVGPSWSVYWEVADARASAAQVRELGGSVVDDAQDTPYGTIATVADPAGAPLRLRTAPTG
ncbi:MAG TPA: VOC family protein [Acidimicrobiales bacterium]|nr:VOC family protein [Acidimicrobiales bacterium]